MITHSRETYQPTSIMTIMRWDRGIFNGSGGLCGSWFDVWVHLIKSRSSATKNTRIWRLNGTNVSGTHGQCGNPLSSENHDFWGLLQKTYGPCHVPMFTCGTSMVVYGGTYMYLPFLPQHESGINPCMCLRTPSISLLEKNLLYSPVVVAFPLRINRNKRQTANPR